MEKAPKPELVSVLLLFSEVKEFFGADIQGVAEVKHHIQGNGAVGGLDPAHVGSADIHQLRQPALRKPALFAVVGDVQPQIFVFVMLSFFHKFTPG